MASSGNPWAKRVLMSLVASIVLCDLLPASVQADEVLQSVLTSWRDRAAKWPSLRVSWKERVRIPRGAFFSAERAVERNLPLEFADTGVPKTETTLQYDTKMLIQGDWNRYETKLIKLNSRFQPVLLGHISSFDGQISRTFRGGLDDKPGHGEIQIAERNLGAQTVLLEPLFLFLRPIHRHYGTLEEMSLRVIEGNLDSAQETVVLESGKESMPRRVWVNRQQAFVVTRWELHVEDDDASVFGMRLVNAADVKYAAHSDLGFAPIAWTISSFDDSGNPKIRYEASDVKIEVSKPIPRAEFNVEFPAGTEVDDRRPKGSFFTAG